MKTALRIKAITASLAGCLAAVAIASTAAVAIASTAAVGTQAPTPAKAAPIDVVRLDPVVVTVSKAHFDAVRKAEQGAATEIARTAEPKSATRG